MDKVKVETLQLLGLLVRWAATCCSEVSVFCLFPFCNRNLECSVNDIGNGNLMTTVNLKIFCGKAMTQNVNNLDFKSGKKCIKAGTKSIRQVPKHLANKENDLKVTFCGTVHRKHETR